MTTDLDELRRELARQHGEELDSVQTDADGRLTLVTKTNIRMTFRPDATALLAQHLMQALRITLTFDGSWMVKAEPSLWRQHSLRRRRRRTHEAPKPKGHDDDVCEFVLDEGGSWHCTTHGCTMLGKHEPVMCASNPKRQRLERGEC
jgi:hypothetical protein